MSFHPTTDADVLDVGTRLRRMLEYRQVFPLAITMFARQEPTPAMAAEVHLDTLSGRKVVAWVEWDWLLKKVSALEGPRPHWIDDTTRAQAARWRARAQEMAALAMLDVITKALHHAHPGGNGRA